MEVDQVLENRRDQMARERREYEQQLRARSALTQGWVARNPIAREAAVRMAWRRGVEPCNLVEQPVPGYDDDASHPYSAQSRPDIAVLTKGDGMDADLKRMWDDSQTGPRRETFGWIRQNPETGQYWLDRNVDVDLYGNGKGAVLKGNPPPNTKALAHTHNFYLSSDRDKDGLPYQRGTWPSIEDYATAESLGMPGIILGEYGKYYYGETPR